MPTSTARYRFEFRVLDWAEGFARGLCGRRCSFFVGLRPDGTIRRIYFAQPGEPLDGDKKAALADAYEGWFLYSPYDEPGSGYIEWLGLPEEIVARWIGRPLELTDYLDVRTTASRDGWPDGWRVIVG